MSCVLFLFLFYRWRKTKTKKCSAKMGQDVKNFILVLQGEIEIYFRASLVVQWLRILLPMQGTRVRALVREYPTCHGATKPVHRNYWACALEPGSHNYWARVPQLLKPACLEPVLHNKAKPPQWGPRTATKRSPRSLQLEKAHVQQRRPNAAKNK